MKPETLAGQVPAYAGTLAAMRAAGRVFGVRAVADELRLQLSGQPRDDSEIARAIARAGVEQSSWPAGEGRFQLQPFLSSASSRRSGTSSLSGPSCRWRAGGCRWRPR